MINTWWTKQIVIYTVLAAVLCGGCPQMVAGQNIHQVDSLYKRGRYFIQRGILHKAGVYLKKAYDGYSKSQATDTLIFNAGFYYARTLVYQGHYKKAMQIYDTLARLTSSMGDLNRRKSNIYNSMGWALKRKGEIEKAMSYYHKSLTFGLKSGDSLMVGVIYSNMGNIYSKRGKNAEAMNVRRRAYTYLSPLGDDKHNAIILNNIGRSYEALFLYDKALSFYKRSLKIVQELGNNNLIAQFYNNIAGVQRRLTGYPEAIIAYQKSLHYSQKAGLSILRARTLNNIGVLYKKLGKDDKALSYYRQSLEIKRKNVGPSSVAITINNIAQLLFEQGHYNKANSYFAQALAMKKKVGSPYEISFSLKGMAEVKLREKKLEAATAIIRQIGQIADSTGNKDIMEDAFILKAELASSRDRPRKALRNYRQAYICSKSLSLKKQLGPLKELAQTFHQLHSDSAFFYGQKAVDLIEKLRSDVGGISNFKTGFFKAYSNFYIRLASWMVEAHKNKAKAFRLIEMAKARSFSDELAAASQNIEQHLPEDVRITQSKKKRSISKLYAQLEGAKTQQERKHISTEIRNKELSYAAYVNNLHQSYPQFKTLHQPHPIALDKVQKFLNEDTAALDYAVTNAKLLIFFITSDQVAAREIRFDKAGRTQLAEQVTQFKHAILTQAPRDMLDKKSKPLYRWLIQPFRSKLDDYANLMIIPDGPLAYVPFEALLHDGKYLVENFCIKYEPSLTTFSQLNIPSPSQRKKLIAVGDATSSGKNSPQSQRGGSSWTQLPSTQMEIDSIAAQFGDVTKLTGSNVSEHALKQLLAQHQYRYVHFATHGEVNKKYAQRSGLMLSAQAGDTTKEDGMLRSSEIYGMNINAGLVVLSACKTGIGKIINGEGILGLQRSFLYAGASTVVASLWNVYDRSTASFMNKFYKDLLNHSDSWRNWPQEFLRWTGWDSSLPFGQKAKAVHIAKLQMLHSARYHEPVYWAPFIVIGR